jgi:hypothetical protein
MDSLPEPARSSPEASTAAPRLISGGRAIGAFIVLAAVLAGILLFTRRDHQTTPPPTSHVQPGTFSLTNSQAIAKFKQLDHLHLQAYQRRDDSLLAQVLTSDSPMQRSAYRDIARLRADGVLDKTTFRTRKLWTRSNTPKEIVLRQVVIQKPLFVTEAGKDVSRLHERVIATIDWTLRKDGIEWRIFDSSVIRAHRLGSSD